MASRESWGTGLQTEGVESEDQWKFHGAGVDCSATQERCFVYGGYVTTVDCEVGFANAGDQSVWADEPLCCEVKGASKESRLTARRVAEMSLTAMRMAGVPDAYPARSISLQRPALAEITE